MTGEFVTHGHLGGYVAGGDPDCVYPDLWGWLVNECDVKTVLDVGCGDGATIDAFAALGAVAVGIDGVRQDHPYIACHDFATGPAPGALDVDLVWSCEFVEHVEERYVDHFLTAFRRGRLLLMTHALPGQPGWHHVNCQNSAYWIENVEAAGFVHDAELTKQTRLLAGHGYYQRTGLAFRRGN